MAAAFQRLAEKSKQNSDEQTGRENQPEHGGLRGADDSGGVDKDADQGGDTDELRCPRI